MKYFAKLGLNSRVTGITHVGDNNAPTEEAGIEYLNKLHSYPFWKEFTKDGSTRKNGAVKGMTYDEDRDAFIPKQPYSSWTLNETTCRWEAPVEMPLAEIVTERLDFNWNEETTSWDERV